MVRRLINATSLRFQILSLCVLCGLITGICAAVSMVFPWPQSSLSLGSYTLHHWRLTSGVLLVTIVGLVCIIAAINRVVRAMEMLRAGMERVSAGDLQLSATLPSPTSDIAALQTTFQQMVERLSQVQADNDNIHAALRRRNQTVDRLLEFSQTIQGAGHSEQIFSTLCQFLQNELALSGVVLLSHEPDAVVPAQIKFSLPQNVVAQSDAGRELEAALCPCLRQHQARLFRCDGASVRCMIDSQLQDALSQPAYCIPFNIGHKLQLALHMLLPQWESWTDERRQLAHTYVNTAQSALTSLHLLADAEQQSMTDALTGLYNRRSLEQLLEREMALAERHNRPLALFMVDIDRFKPINDSRGHAAGDHLLKAFADCVRMTLRKTDLAFRYGGDEFVVALPQTTLAQAQQVVQKLRQSFASVDFSSAITHLEGQPTLSIGIAERSAAQNLLTLSALLSAADQALYDAKSADRNCVKTFQPPRAA